MRATPIAALSLAAMLAGCASPGGPGAVSGAPAAAAARKAKAAADEPIAPFSAMKQLDPSGPWISWTLPAKRPTRYAPVDVGGVRVIEAVADSSVSGLRHALDVDPEQRPILEWRWRVDRTLEGADVGDRHADDSPVRIVLAFDGDIGSLPIKEQMFFERVKLLAGQDMPYATVMYVWCNKRQPEAIASNPHTGRVQKIVVEHGTDGVGQWRTYRRDIVADYERAYGRKPGRLIGVGVMSDSDNTKQSARGWYGDIRLLARDR
jgi:hypothetical protein